MHDNQPDVHEVRPAPRYLTSVPGVFVVSCIAFVFCWLARDWLPGLAIAVLWLGWAVLAVGHPPVIALAFSHQWIQVSIGLFFTALTGIQLTPMLDSDYRPMVLLGLGCLVALLVGLAIGMRPAPTVPKEDNEYRATTGELVVWYILSMPLTRIIQEVAWQWPGFTQAVLALNFVRFGLLFLIFRRLSHPTLRWGWFLLILVGEIVFGFSGYFAGFREALVLAALSLIDVFDRRQVRHWFAATAVAAFVLVAGMAWTDIKVGVRQDLDREEIASSRWTRLTRVADRLEDWAVQSREEFVDNAREMVDRMWPIYYPALAVQRVPEVLPHEGGALMWRAIAHVFSPRILNPEKEEVESDSLMVRRYAGINVAGPESGTSIAFGYAGESYVDFGVPLMFLPVFLYGLAMGRIHRWLSARIVNREMAMACLTVVFWLSLYLFERSWLRTLGIAGTLVVYLGGLTLIIDRATRSMMIRRAQGRRPVPAPVASVR